MLSMQNMENMQNMQYMKNKQKMQNMENMEKNMESTKNVLEMKNCKNYAKLNLPNQTNPNLANPAKRTKTYRLKQSTPGSVMPLAMFSFYFRVLGIFIRVTGYLFP